MKKNCLNCKHLTEEYEQDSDGYEIGGGYYCDKQYQKSCMKGTEDQFIENLDRPSYREKAKVCFEPIAQKRGIEMSCDYCKGTGIDPENLTSKSELPCPACKRSSKEIVESWPEWKKNYKLTENSVPQSDKEGS